MLTLAMLEAMACGLPVVATADAAYDRYDFDTADLALVPARPDALRGAFREILGDDERRSRMAASSRRLAEECFDWHRNAGDLAEIYRAGTNPGAERAPGAARTGDSPE